MVLGCEGYIATEERLLDPDFWRVWWYERRGRAVKQGTSQPSVIYLELGCEARIFVLRCNEDPARQCRQGSDDFQENSSNIA